ncbi:MAG: hypothetical protein HYW90_04750 [Candidatus Sungbacteria bacterium]|nr:hypothetical protein [Candidatus Sungbacteria bacterium]
MENGFILKAEKELDRVSENSAHFQTKALCAVGYAILAVAEAIERHAATNRIVAEANRRT